MLFFKNTNRIKFVEFTQNYISVCCYSQGFKWKLNSICNILKDYEQQTDTVLYTDSFTVLTCERFMSYLQQTRNLKNNSIRDIVSKIITLLNKAEGEGYRVKNSLKKVFPRYEFTTQVYLTVDELKRLYDLDNLSIELELVRDVFLIGCFTGLRKSDLLSLTAENFQDRYIITTTKKTKIQIKIPIHPTVRQIFIKYNYQMPILHSDQSYNMQIKKVCKAACIADIVKNEFTKGGKRIVEHVHKFELISSHTARRTAITNMYLNNTPLLSIMSATGLLSLQNMLLYIRVSNVEHLKTLEQSFIYDNIMTIETRQDHFKHVKQFIRKRSNILRNG